MDEIEKIREYHRLKDLERKIIYENKKIKPKFFKNERRRLSNYTGQYAIKKQ
jgi:hypothetical protein